MEYVSAFIVIFIQVVIQYDYKIFRILHFYISYSINFPSPVHNRVNT